MSESINVFQDNDEFWDYVKENPRVLGIPVSEHKGLDLLSALKDVREAYKKDAQIGDTMLTLLGSLLLGIVNGEGEAMIEEVIVSEAMVGIDKEIKKVLNEGH
jgi:hypothetical protein